MRYRSEEIYSGKTTTKLVCFLAGELQVGTVLIEGVLRHGDLAPEIGGEEGVCFGDLIRRQFRDISRNL